MHINSFNPIINNIYKQNIRNERSQFNNLSPLSKDTISFGASASTRKLVEDFLKEHSIIDVTVEDILNSFGEVADKIKNVRGIFD